MTTSKIYWRHVNGGLKSVAALDTLWSLSMTGFGTMFSMVIDFKRSTIRAKSLNESIRYRLHSAIKKFGAVHYFVGLCEDGKVLSEDPVAGCDRLVCFFVADSCLASDMFKRQALIDDIRHCFFTKLVTLKPIASKESALASEEFLSAFHSCKSEKGVFMTTTEVMKNSMASIHMAVKNERAARKAAELSAQEVKPTEVALEPSTPQPEPVTTIKIDLDVRISLGDERLAVDTNELMAMIARQLASQYGRQVSLH